MRETSKYVFYGIVTSLRFIWAQLDLWERVIVTQPSSFIEFLIDESYLFLSVILVFISHRRCSPSNLSYNGDVSLSVTMCLEQTETSFNFAFIRKNRGNVYLTFLCKI